MSAFICGQDHFIALAVFAAHRKAGRDWTVDPRYVKGLTHPEAALRGLLESIRRAAIRALPGYDKAPWDFYADEQQAA